MDREEWLDKLKNSTAEQRTEIATRKDCPEFLLDIMVRHDVEDEVITASISNSNCPVESIEIGKTRLTDILAKKNKYKNTSLCPLPWNHLQIQQNGDLRQCCLMINKPHGKLLNSETGKFLTFNDIEDARNHPVAKNLRKDMIENKRPSACSLCWDEENIGISSKRLSMLKKFNIDDMIKNTSKDGTIDVDAVPLEYLDLRLGNLCNLRCRSCGPGDSSLWVDDYAKLAKPINNKIVMNYYDDREYELKETSTGWEIDSNDFEWYNNQNFHNWIDKKILNGLSTIYFTGGEPTVNKHHMRILERIIELDKSNNTVLEYNTNMVAIPPKLLKMWEKFKSVELGASIDAIGPLASYVRNPSNWNIIEKNCDKIGYGQIPTIVVGVATTISVLNIRNFADLTKWLFSKKYTSIKKIPSWHLLIGPNYFNLQCLPIETKKIIVDEFNNLYEWVKINYGNIDSDNIRTNYDCILAFMNQDETQHLLPKLRDSLINVDKIRNEKIETAIPWLYDIIKQLPK